METQRRAPQARNDAEKSSCDPRQADGEIVTRDFNLDCADKLAVYGELKIFILLRCRLDDGSDGEAH